MNVFSKDKKELEYSLNKIEGLCQAKGIITKRAYFRQEMGIISCFPLMENNKIIKDIIYFILKLSKIKINKKLN